MIKVFVCISQVWLSCYYYSCSLHVYIWCLPSHTMVCMHL